MIYTNLTAVEAAAIPNPKYVWDNLGVFTVYTGEDIPPVTSGVTYVSTADNYSMTSTNTTIEVTAPDKTITLVAPTGLAGRQVIIANNSSGQVTISGALDGVASCVIQTGTSLTLVSNGTVWLFSSQYYVPDGWGDITPIYVKDDGANNFTFGLITGSRYGLIANNTNPVRRVHCRYHIPHTIVLGQAAGTTFVHLHWESVTNAAGNIIIVARIAAALRDGLWTNEYTLTYTLTPSTALSAGEQIVTELPLPNGLEAYLVPDALFDIGFERNRGANAGDTFNNSFIFHTADLHVKLDGRQTTSKDPAWVKV